MLTANPSSDEFERFRALVLRDPALLRQLREATSIPDFLALAVHLGAVQGCVFTTNDVRAAMQAARRALIIGSL